MRSEYHPKNALLSSWNVMTPRKNEDNRSVSAEWPLFLRVKSNRTKMFAVFTTLSSLIFKPREGRQALLDENAIRTGVRVATKPIDRESSEDKRVRKQLAVNRCKERIQQQVKLVRLMKKLLIKADRDEEFESSRSKVAQIELKIAKAAREKDVNCDDMFDLDKPDDANDIQLEKLITPTDRFQLNTTNDRSIYDAQASGDHAESKEMTLTIIYSDRRKTIDTKSE